MTTSKDGWTWLCRKWKVVWKVCFVVNWGKLKSVAVMLAVVQNLPAWVLHSVLFASMMTPNLRRSMCFAISWLMILADNPVWISVQKLLLSSFVPSSTSVLTIASVSPGCVFSILYVCFLAPPSLPHQQESRLLKIPQKMNYFLSTYVECTFVIQKVKIKQKKKKNETNSHDAKILKNY